MSAIENVVVDVNGNMTKGRDAFLAAISSTSAGEGAFPNKIFHDDYVLADGRLGAIEYVWHGRQSKKYGNIAANNTLVRMRGMLFFEFNQDLKVEKVASVYDEAVIATQLQGLVQYLLSLSFARVWCGITGEARFRSIGATQLLNKYRIAQIDK